MDHAKLRATVPYKVFNRYRGLMTGPVVIPKLYDGHNKTFFMFAGDGFTMPYGGRGSYRPFAEGTKWRFLRSAGVREYLPALRPV